ncbi:hypothetical protein WR25_26400 [Diploscapter pachys]|jgi:lambda repressor-like predicted transcriptional regulator|uniref:Ner winged helix-turn-helix DNA-binding domain-containing protein n=1 Tax=Diploscapter pachys TaxID=2018661 RepID=A0A2A2M1S0_9BILA|nr:MULTISPECIES: helix-turn-helix domain-containing protein [Sphingomonas]PAV92398.1 hypothetical protein WR25_26400 [Diploscapter pachys]
MNDPLAEFSAGNRWRPRLHREDVKAAIRKRFGSLKAFERAENLPLKSVSGVLAGRKSDRVQRAINGLFQDAPRDIRGVVDNYRPETRSGKSA